MGRYQTLNQEPNIGNYIVFEILNTMPTLTSISPPTIKQTWDITLNSDQQQNNSMMLCSKQPPLHKN